MKVSMSLLLYIEGKPFGEKPSNLHLDTIMFWFDAVRSAYTVLPSAGSVLSFSHPPLLHHRLHRSCQPKLFYPSFPLYPLRYSSYIFCVVHHGFERPVSGFPQDFSSSLRPLRTHHDHMLGVLRRIPTLASRIFNSGDVSSVQISVEPDVLASYLCGNTTLGPLQVLVDGRWSSLQVHS